MDGSKRKQTGDTVRIKRPPPKVFTDELGRNVWMSGVEPCRLELESDGSLEFDPYNSGVIRSAAC
ncbi:MAG: hypothetical protein QNI99_03795 [Woeseiaceae bacterium]|nr:hypothetical protein [Woeseiaceae bacterium]